MDNREVDVIRLLAKYHCFFLQIGYRYAAFKIKRSASNFNNSFAISI